MRQKTKTNSHWGKKLLFTLMAGCALQSNVFSQSCGTTTDDYSSNTNWTEVGTTILVDNNNSDRLDFISCTDGVPAEYAYRTLSSALSNTSWVCDFKFELTSGYNSAHSLIALTEDNLNAHGDKNGSTIYYSDMDAIEVFVNSNNGDITTNGCGIRGRSKSGSGTVQYITTPITWAASGNINVSTGTTYWGRLQRLSATKCMLSIYSNSGMTTHISGSPVCWTIDQNIQGLDILQHSNGPEGAPSRTLTAWVDDVELGDLDPYISGPSIVCSSSPTQTYTLNTCSSQWTTIPEATYSWSLPAGSSGSSSTNSINATIGSTGTVSCTVTTCTGTTITYTYSVTYDNPVANAGSDVSGCCGTPTYIGGTGGNPTASGGTAPYTYSWSPSTGLSSTTVANPSVDICGSFSIGQYITYTVTITDANGCTATDQVTVDRSCRLIDPSLNNDPIKGILENAIIYPNPSTGEFTIDLGGEFEAEHTVMIKDVLGRTVYTAQNGLKDGLVKLRLDDQPNGIYFLYVEYEGNAVIRKLLKE